MVLEVFETILCLCTTVLSAEKIFEILFKNIHQNNSYVFFKSNSLSIPTALIETLINAAFSFLKKVRH
jgi:hypothetical protein